MVVWGNVEEVAATKSLRVGVGSITIRLASSTSGLSGGTGEISANSG